MFVSLSHIVTYLLCTIVTVTTPRTVLWKPDLSARRGPLYRAIVDALRGDVEEGRLHPGDRLPTQRSLAVALGVGLGTVTHAYREAERAGIIQSRVGRGTFVAQPGSADPLGLPDAGLVEMSVDLPIHAEDPDLAAALQKISRSSAVSRLLRYHHHAGTARHRQAGAAWAERFEMPARPDDVVVCAGSQHALCVSLMAVAGPGDVVLCDELTYPGIRAVTDPLRLRLCGVAMDEHGLLPDAVDAACRQRRVRALYTVPSFHNPTTAQLDATRRRTLADLARRHDFVMLEDDVHRLLSTRPPPPIATLAPERTFYIASFSKAVTGGLRVAFLIPPRDLVTRTTDAVWGTVWMVPTLPVEVAATWIEDGTADDIVRRKRKEAGRRQRTCDELLDGFPFAAQPHGYYAWLELPEVWSSAGFAQEARRRGVAVTPSTAFVVGPASPPNAVRVCVAAPETADEMRRGLLVLRELLRSGPDRRHAVM